MERIPKAPEGHLASGDFPLASTLSIADTLRPFGPRFAAAGMYFVVLLAIATVGYHWIEGWPWPDALYMSVTTISAVGFMEVHPLTPTGRNFTMFIIALGVTGLGIWWALTTALIVELDLGGALRRRKKMKRIESLDGHYIVCGAGRVGRMVVREIERAGLPLVIVERDRERATALEDADPDRLVICGDSTKERVLLEAGIQRAHGLAACLADDADNLLVCLTARDMNPGVSTVARAYDEESMDRLRRAGADHVISPTLTGGIRMATTLLQPNVVSFLDSAVMGPDLDLRLQEAVIPQGSPLVGRSLVEARIPQKTGLVVIALQRGGPGGALLYNPGPGTLLETGDVMLVLGRQGQVEELRTYAEAG